MYGIVRSVSGVPSACKYTPSGIAQQGSTEEAAISGRAMLDATLASSRGGPLGCEQPLQPLFDQFLIRALAGAGEPVMHFPHRHRVNHAGSPD
jgi:hypothetical protein